MTSLIHRAKQLASQASRSLDADRALMLAMAGLIEHARHDWPTRPELSWQPNQPIRLLFAGYSGTRNTGADVRVEAMVAQFRHVLGARNVDLSIVTHDTSRTAGYFRGAKQIVLPQIFPAFLHRTIRDQHGVVACEGSMFKSKFATALSTFMVGSLGLAAAGEKLAIAYGGEAGEMTPALSDMVARYCRDAWVVTRNEESQKILGDLGLKTELGTDTAWPFCPAPPDVGRACLRAAGWDGEREILVICPINAFWWPVKPDITRAIDHALTQRHQTDHYASIYFHYGGPRVRAAQSRYLDALAQAATAFRKQTNAFIVIVGMEQLDRGACEALRQRLGDEHTGLLVSDTVEMFELVSAIRHARWMISSRYHALVTAMPAGVVGVGVTMDERIHNLMRDRTTPELALDVDDPNLAQNLAHALERVLNHEDAIRLDVEKAVVRNTRLMGEMGRKLAQHVHNRLPSFPLPDGMGEADAWHHLPPLDPTLQALCDKHPADARP